MSHQEVFKRNVVDLITRAKRHAETLGMTATLTQLTSVLETANSEEPTITPLVGDPDPSPDAPGSEADTAHDE